MSNSHCLLTAATQNYFLTSTFYSLCWELPYLLFSARLGTMSTGKQTYRSLIGFASQEILQKPSKSLTAFTLHCEGEDFLSFLHKAVSLLKTDLSALCLQCLTQYLAHNRYSISVRELNGQMESK